ncbi:branched-chain amino acid ABC transporter substrate-binding protein [Streptomyces sp. YIM 98790]|uniref:branched-chain amino acid ABC transporter substrate-binding protein n=1 Tax=Streptomyces sp. YIM 98790 TaxID=2689077 RepID=UPI00140CD376|nr:branched-chain amino acid ABC transporter substrate-binding protein [Streptomyces sp. YIM 98790]
MLTKRLAKLAIPFAIGALALTACSDDSNGGSGGGGGGGDGATFKIAYQGPLSGPNVQLGVNMVNGVQLAIDEANESGEYDVKFELFEADDGGEPGKATAAAQSAIDAGVIAVVGPAFSGAAEVAAPNYGEAGIAALTPSATRPDLTEKGFKTFLRAVPSDAEQGKAIADFFVSQDIAKAVLIDDTDDYAVGLADVAQQHLEEAGVEVVRESVPADTVDHSGIARTVVESGAGAVAYTGYYSQAGPLAVKLNEAGYEGIGLGGDGVKDPQFVSLAGAAAENWYLSCPCRDLTTDEAGQSFIDRYKAAFDAEPGTYSPEAYDATKMIIEAVAELGDGADAKSVYEALAAGTHEGVAKTLSFTETGEYNGAGIYMYQVTGGAITSLGDITEVTGG